MTTVAISSRYMPMTLAGASDHSMKMAEREMAMRPQASIDNVQNFTIDSIPSHGV
ncbi:hypothetical protein GCM10025858_29430 [Alicyclobacillus sacchari]|nr:hypothetical protein GCM10025858_29430 [Alicyclobacillus sacchari]